MDLVAACRAFVNVAERGSFTLGAEAASVPQSVASRRVAALEAHFGARLFDRSTRSTALTVFGRDMLPSAKRLVQLAESMEYNAERVKLRPVPLAVPESSSVRHRALLDAAAREVGTVFDFRLAPPAERVELLRSREVRLALVAVPRTEASWVVPLGLASATRPRAKGPVHIETLRPPRRHRSFRRIWVQPEDDTAHVRDRLEQAGHRAALLPAQVMVADSVTAGVSDAMGTDNLVLSSAAEAADWGLHWRPVAGVELARGFDLAGAPGDDPRPLQVELWTEMARCLGVPAASARSGGTHVIGDDPRSGERP